MVAIGDNTINLVVRHLNRYVGKERTHCFLVAQTVAMPVNAVAMVVRGNWDRNQQFSPCHQTSHT